MHLTVWSRDDRETERTIPKWVVVSNSCTAAGPRNQDLVARSLLRDIGDSPNTKSLVLMGLKEYLQRVAYMQTVRES